jgi:polyhydroxybutyrate depolymerase
MSLPTRAVLIVYSLTIGCAVDTPADPVGAGGSNAGTGGSGAAGSGATTAGSGGKGAGGSSGVGAGGAGGTGTGTGGTTVGGSSGGGSGGGSGGSGGSGTSGAGASSGGASGSIGTSGSAGSAGTGGATQSSGCGSTMTPASGALSIDVDGTSRDYILAVPDDYDSDHPYPLVFGWHWRGGSAEDVAGSGFLGGYYGLEELADGSAIFVAPDGIDDGWANTGGRDIAFLDAMLARFKSELCIDESRIFSTGFSYGGMMSFAVACARADVFRAIAPMSGALYSGCEDGDLPIAVWGAHGDEDDVVPLSDGQAGLEVFLERNHCESTAMPTTPSPCVTYQGCDAGYPVTWCEFEGGHSPPSFATDAIWEFFSGF